MTLMKDRIVRLLKESTGYRSGEELSKVLNISRAAICKNIQDLRTQGYDIHAVKNLGYRLKDLPKTLWPREITWQLPTRVIGQSIVHKMNVESTMDEALQLGLHGAAEGTVMVAETQTRGKGRLGRQWLSPSGQGLYFSLILRPKMPVRDVAQVTLMSAVAVARCLREDFAVAATIKWPNDVLVDGKKISGILTELHAEIDRVCFVIVGIGLNVHGYDERLKDSATSLDMAHAGIATRVDVLKKLLVRFEEIYRGFCQSGFASTRQQWLHMASTIGQRIRVSQGDQIVEGVAQDLDESGALLVVLADGQVVKHISGDVLEIDQKRCLLDSMGEHQSQVDWAHG